MNIWYVYHTNMYVELIRNLLIELWANDPG